LRRFFATKITQILSLFFYIAIMAMGYCFHYNKSTLNNVERELILMRNNVAKKNGGYANFVSLGSIATIIVVFLLVAIESGLIVQCC
jgi:hypothetical protein